MDGLIQLCRENGVSVEYERMTRSGRVLGWFRLDWDGQPLIILDKSLLAQPRLHRCILAEEFGHYVTVPQGTLIRSYVASSGDRGIRGRDEYRAVKWAANWLIPTYELRQLMLRDGRPVDEHVLSEYAEHFYVTRWLMRRKLHYMREELEKVHRLRVRVQDLSSPLLVNQYWGLKEVHVS